MFETSEISVGRVQGNDLMLPKGNVSKRHARVLHRDGRFIVTDLNSTNGTYVNRRRITQATIVREGDRIFIGDFVLRVESADPTGDAPPPAPSLTPGPRPVVSDSGQPSGAMRSAADEDDELTGSMPRMVAAPRLPMPNVEAPPAPSPAAPAARTTQSDEEDTQRALTLDFVAELVIRVSRALPASILENSRGRGARRPRRARLTGRLDAAQRRAAGARSVRSRRGLGARRIARARCADRAARGRKRRRNRARGTPASQRDPQRSRTPPRARLLGRCGLTPRAGAAVCRRRRTARRCAAGRAATARRNPRVGDPRGIGRVAGGAAQVAPTVRLARRSGAARHDLPRDRDLLASVSDGAPEPTRGRAARRRDRSDPGRASCRRSRRGDPVRWRARRQLRQRLAASRPRRSPHTSGARDPPCHPGAARSPDGRARRSRSV